MLHNDKLEEWDRENFFHPSTHLAEFARGNAPQRVIKTGHGSTIVDRDGTELLDGFAGLYCVNVGYGRQEIAEAIASAVRSVDDRLRLFGLAGSELIVAGQAQGLRVANEVFVDRTYRADGSLTSREHPQALIDDVNTGVSHVMAMLCDGVVPTIDGTMAPVVADTICVHGDGPHAVGYVRELRAALTRAGVEIGSRED